MRCNNLPSSSKRLNPTRHNPAVASNRTLLTNFCVSLSNFLVFLVFFSLSDSLLLKWIEIHSLEKILNKRSTTWRNLNENLKNNFEKNYIKIIIENTSLIKRPFWEFNYLPERELTPGFDQAHQNFILKIK